MTGEVAFCILTTDGHPSEIESRSSKQEEVTLFTQQFGSHKRENFFKIQYNVLINTKHFKAELLYDYNIQYASGQLKSFK